MVPRAGPMSPLRCRGLIQWACTCGVSWFSNLQKCTSACRLNGAPTSKNDFIDVWLVTGQI